MAGSGLSVSLKGGKTAIKLTLHLGIKKAREFQKNIIDYAKAFDCVDHNKFWKILIRDGNTRPPDLPLEKSV